MSSSPQEDLLRAFYDDLDTNLHDMEELLISSSEQSLDTEDLNRLYRALHSVKGNSAIVGFSLLTSLSHVAEDLVSIVRDNQLSIDDESIDLLLEVLDKINDLADLYRDSPDDVKDGLCEDLVTRLKDKRERTAPAEESVEELPDELAAGFLFDEDDGVAWLQDTQADQVKEAPVAGQDNAPSSSSAPAKNPKQTNRASRKKGGFVRVPSEKIEQMIELVGELSLVAGGLVDSSRAAGLKGNHLRLERLLHELRDSASGLGLVPAADLFTKTKRLVRELQKATSKDIKLHVTGEDTEIDKVVVDRLIDPLMHIVRNSADHGIEMPDIREQAGKPRAGSISLDCTQQGGEVCISITDDGAGLNTERIRAKAIANGLVDETEYLSDEQIWPYIFHPGFSTAAAVSNLSGRGVGMDVVQTEVSSLRGRISIDTVPGRGTQFQLHLPLSLAFTDGMVFRAMGRSFVIPLTAVAKILRPKSEQLVRNSADKSHKLNLSGEFVPVLWLQDFYGEEYPREDDLSQMTMVIVKSSQGVWAIPVECLLGSEQVSFKPLQGALKKIDAAAGCALLRSGDVAVAIDCEKLHHVEQ